MSSKQRRYRERKVQCGLCGQCGREEIDVERSRSLGTRCLNKQRRRMRLRRRADD